MDIKCRRFSIIFTNEKTLRYEMFKLNLQKSN